MVGAFHCNCYKQQYTSTWSTRYLVTGMEDVLSPASISSLVLLPYLFVTAVCVPTLCDTRTRIEGEFASAANRRLLVGAHNHLRAYEYLMQDRYSSCAVHNNLRAYEYLVQDRCSSCVAPNHLRAYEHLMQDGRSGCSAAAQERRQNVNHEDQHNQKRTDSSVYSIAHPHLGPPYPRRRTGWMWPLV